MMHRTSETGEWVSVSTTKQPYQPRIIVTGGAEITLPPDDHWIIGRAVANGITVSVDLSKHGGWEGGVSRQHICIRRTEEGFTIEDLGSHNETLVNSERLAIGQQYPLANGDLLTLGAWRGVFVIE